MYWYLPGSGMHRLMCGIGTPAGRDAILNFVRQEYAECCLCCLKSTHFFHGIFISLLHILSP
ncbi:hypothetical protein I7I50_07300 [Histoplasma capsulatum G186AR]|uniref:Uncharacterized protein n=1 Tax=Ajellomyces capsulatus TaxID=5037 RepID=A0A8H7YVK0_AJECA|nr:hypothetical protein I7I52_09629 [Histoplasma capsulatum]QSS68030.1 hypothetical protein I7I50_07300 [Histoplasma capsulatum G186AR]